MSAGNNANNDVCVALHAVTVTYHSLFVHEKTRQKGHLAGRQGDKGDGGAFVWGTNLRT